MSVDPAALQPGDVVARASYTFTRESLVRYAGASTDFNPIHFSEPFAISLGLPGIVAHGMLTMGTALRAVTDWVGDPGRVRSYSTRFTRPVVVPADGEATVDVTVTVVDVVEAVATVTLEVTSGGEKVLGMARAEVDLV